LVKELRLAQINTIAVGNQFLQNGYCDQLNERFAVAPRSQADFHRSAKGYDLPSIFCIEEERSVSVDWIVRFENQFYQVQPLRQAQAPKGRVLVRRYLNGDLHFCYDARDLPYTLLPERPKRKTVDKIKSKRHHSASGIIKPYVPPADHQWRGFRFGKGPPWAR
jgi:hypothetical protein